MTSYFRIRDDVINFKKNFTRFVPIVFFYQSFKFTDNTSYEISSREPMCSQKIIYKKFPESDLAFPYN